MMPEPDRLVVASYNVHGCVGMDGRRDPERVADVIAELKADVVALQEVDSQPQGAGGIDQLAVLADASGCGYTFVHGPTLLRGDAHYGNGLLTRLPVRSTRFIDLSLPDREPRGAIDAELIHADARIRVVTTHLGLRAGERNAQFARLLDCLGSARDFDLVVLLGDFNEWWPPRSPLARLHRLLGRTRSVRSFPAPAPLFALDRIWVEPSNALREVRAHRSALSRRASDHLPIRAVIESPLAAARRRGA